jgi:hypothetical protein
VLHAAHTRACRRMSETVYRVLFAFEWGDVRGGLDMRLAMMLRRQRRPHLAGTSPIAAANARFLPYDGRLTTSIGSSVGGLADWQAEPVGYSCDSGMVGGVSPIRRACNAAAAAVCDDVSYRPDMSVWHRRRQPFSVAGSMALSCHAELACAQRRRCVQRRQRPAWHVNRHRRYLPFSIAEQGALLSVPIQV